MEITFKYNGKLISTPNLEKKLKRMKISLEDIEIVPNKIIVNEEIEDNKVLDRERVIIRSTSDNIRRICYIKKGTRPSIEMLFEKVMWNPTTKTGIKELTKEFLKTMYYEH